MTKIVWFVRCVHVLLYHVWVVVYTPLSVRTSMQHVLLDLGPTQPGVNAWLRRAAFLAD